MISNCKLVLLVVTVRNNIFLNISVIEMKKIKSQGSDRKAKVTEVFVV